MAFNWKTFRTRSASAAIFVLIMAAGVLWNHWSFFILFSIIHFGCWREYQRLVTAIDPGYGKITAAHRYGVMLAGWCFMLFCSTENLAIAGFPLHVLGWWLGLISLFLLPLLELLFNPSIRVRNIGYSAGGIAYISLSWGLLMDLTIPRVEASHPFFSGEDFSIEIPLLIIASVWINDTMAYITGSLIGRTPLSPISPKKTIEGTAGGILLCIAVISFISYKLIGDFNERAIHFTILAGLIAITGTMGDLFESKLKRLAGVKDSGQIMPGHGGFLDRFDSMLIAIPFVWLYVILFLH